MNSHNSDTTHTFPSELVSPEDKEKREYGLKWAKAIYYNNNISGSSIFYNNKDVYRVYMDYALGQQSEAKYKPLLGVNTNNERNSMLPAINWAIRNYATKKINVVVSNVSNRKFDPVAKAIDELANDIKADYKARLQAYVSDMAFINELKAKTNINTNPEGLSENEIPTNHEDIEILMRSNFKFRSEMELEKGIGLHLKRNNYEQIRKQLIWDTFVLGVVASYNELDEYGKPKIERVSPEDLFVPYSELPDFSNINYAGHIKRMTISELKKDAGEEFTDEEYSIIESNHANSTDRDNKNSITTQDSNYKNDTKKVSVLCFEYVTQNELVHLEKTDNFGNKRFARKDYNYYRTEKEQAKFKKKFGEERDIKRTPYTAVYKGKHIVGSEFLYGYKKKSNIPSNRNSFGGTPLGYKIFAPNLFSGNVVSTVKQMIPILDNLQHYQLKIQQIVASAVPKGLEIDLWQLANADFVGANGKSLSDLEKIEMYFQRGIMIRNSQGRTMPGSNNTPIRELENGMANDIVKFIELIRVDLEALDEVVGVNRVMAAGNLHQEAGKATTEMQLQTAHTAIDYIYDADEYVFSEMCKNLAELHIQSVKVIGNQKYYSNIMGENSVRFLMSDHGLEKHDFGIYLETRPDDSAWQRFYMRVQEALKQGQIYINHATRAERIENLKEAEMYLEVAIAEVQKKNQEAKDRDIQMNTQSQQESVKMAHELAMQLEQEKKMTISLEGNEERKTLQLKYQLEKELASVTQGVKGEYKIAETDKLTRSKENIEVLKSQTNKERNNG